MEHLPCYAYFLSDIMLWFYIISNHCNKVVIYVPHNTTLDIYLMNLSYNLQPQKKGSEHFFLHAKMCTPIESRLV